MRFLYSGLLYLSIPLLLAHLLWRSLRAPMYRRRWAERFGFYGATSVSGTVWIHAVSVGEVQAALPIVRLLRERHPGHKLVVTTTTPTGSQRVHDILKGDVVHVYAPYDLPLAVNRFLDHMQPSLAVIMETEIWPNIFHYCHRRGIPVLLANARMSERSARGYHRIPRFTGETLAKATRVAAQTRQDARRLIGLGADPRKVSVTGSVKMDITPPASLHEQAAVLRRAWGVDRAVWIAASTHEGEDEHILDAYAALEGLVRNLLLVLVPRHPERFARVTSLCRRRGFSVVRRSERQPCDEDVQVFVGDTMGELQLFYAASDVAFVGGSLVPHGGQNLLEPAALGVPVIVGPHTFNFEEPTRLLLEAGAAFQVADHHELAARVEQILRDADLRYAMGERGRKILARNQGAVTRLMLIIDELLGDPESAPA